MKYVVSIILFLLFSVANAQVNYDLDFGAGGFVVAETPIGTPSDDYFGGMEFDTQDSEIFFVAMTTLSNLTSTFQIRVIKYQDDGILGMAFGTSSVVTILHSQVRQFCSDIAIQSDGKIIIAGDQTNTLFETDFLLIRLNPDGTLDNTFGTGGVVTIDHNGQDQLTGVIVESGGTGTIYASGLSATAEGSRAVSISVNSAGELNTDYGTNGILQHGTAESGHLVKPIFYDFGAEPAVAYGGYKNLNGFSGAVMNVVTKSTGNEMASESFYYHHDGFNRQVNSLSTGNEGNTSSVWMGVDCECAGDQVLKLAHGALAPDFDTDGIIETQDFQQIQVGHSHTTQTGRLVQTGVNAATGGLSLLSFEQESGGVDPTTGPGGFFTSQTLPAGYVSISPMKILESPDLMSWYSVGVVTSQSMAPNQDIYIAKYNAPNGSVGINETSSNSLQSVYPNPFTNRFVYELPSLLEHNSTFKLFDVLSKEVAVTAHKLSERQVEVRLEEDVPVGMYFLQVQSGSEMFTHKLVRE